MVNRFLCVLMATLVLFTQSTPTVFADHDDHKTRHGEKHSKKHNKSDEKEQTPQQREYTNKHDQEDFIAYLPAELLFASFDLTERYYEQSQILEVFIPNPKDAHSVTHVIFRAERTVMYVNGSKQALPYPPYVEDGSFYLPAAVIDQLRNVMDSPATEQLGQPVKWKKAV